MKHITGLHHITALTSDAQENVDFYAGILGLRMVKKTVNFDAPDIYHLYYGNRTGDPGTIMTFFPYPGMPRGRKGNSQAVVTSFSVPENSLDYWMKRLSRFGVDYQRPRNRFSETYIYFEDSDGLGLELVANSLDSREGYDNGSIPERYSVRGFYGVTLSVERAERTSGLLMGQMDHDLVGEENNRFRFSADPGRAGFTDVLNNPGSQHGRGGAGTVHHVAYATADENTQSEFRERLITGAIVSPTPFIDRQYFRSIYFREPEGVLFETATSNMGFTIDEPLEHLGEELKLPKWEEKNRRRIEALLPEINLHALKFNDAHIHHR